MMVKPTAYNVPQEDLKWLLPRIKTKVNSIWLEKTYPFARFGKRVSIHFSCEISRTQAPYISIGDDVWLAPDVWLTVLADSTEPRSKVIMGNGCQLGRRSIISAKNSIVLGEDVLLAPSVLIMDHNHGYSDPHTPIHKQGVTRGGTILIERNCWLGYNSVIFAAHGELSIGRNSVVGANTIVTKSFPPYSVIAGNPARLIKRFDAGTGEWIRPERKS